jgi:oxidase EvaA
MRTQQSSNYLTSLGQYVEITKHFAGDNIYPHTLECTFESLSDWSLFYSLDEVKAWFLHKRLNSNMHIKEIPLNKVRNWKTDTETGNISHASGEFFIIHGIRVTTADREVLGGWDQPMVTQAGYDGGILGLIRKRFQGIPHYLCEAKMEPGNYGKVQLSPTLQATFSNLKRAHQGRRPFFSDYFESPQDYPDNTVLFNAWLAEDGGRLYLKRNKGMLIEVPESHEVALPNDQFIWLSLYQIKSLLKEDAWINPHIRGILSHV